MSSDKLETFIVWYLKYICHCSPIFLSSPKSPVSPHPLLCPTITPHYLIHLKLLSFLAGLHRSPNLAHVFTCSVVYGIGWCEHDKDETLLGKEQRDKTQQLLLKSEGGGTGNQDYRKKIFGGCRRMLAFPW